jgi:signal transduction histidine kinase
LEEQAQQIELANTMLNEKNTQLEYLVIEKNEFLGIAAHDLKNPITSIKLIASMMQKYRDKITGDDVMKQMQKVEFTATRMEEIVTNLLDINAIESGALSLKAIECDIADTLKAIVEQYRMQADAKGISLIYNHVSSARVIVDPIRAWEVLDNLLSNAIKYSPLGKTIWMTITMKNPNEGAQSEAGDQHSVQIRIHDEGPGLSEEDMAKLFGKFARLSARPTAGEQSTGLGLSIVKKLVEAMNGKVWCESELGKGATFIVELPAVEG